MLASADRGCNRASASTCSRATTEFLRGLRLAQGIADRKSTMPMLATVLLRTHGRGKTNLLKAIFVIAPLRSFRTAKLSDLIAFGQERARLGARVWREISCGSTRSSFTMCFRVVGLWRHS
jgi:hypothetical protein